MRGVFSLICTLCLVMASPAMAQKNNKKDNEVKELSGISIVGNKEAPKSLYIVPWKNSEVGVETSLTSSLLDDSIKLVDKDVFLRELEFYEFSHSGK